MFSTLSARNGRKQRSEVGRGVTFFICLLFFLGVLDRLLFTPFFIPTLRADLVYYEVFILLALALSINVRLLSENRLLLFLAYSWLALSILATALSEHFYTSLWRQSEVFLVLGIGVWLSVLIGLNKRFLTLLSLVILLAFSITALAEFSEWVKSEDPSKQNWSIILKSYFNIRHFGDMASVATLVSIYFIGPGNSGYRRTLGASIFFISLTALLFTGGRASIVAVLFLMLVILFFNRQNVRLIGAVCFLAALAFVSSYILAVGNPELGPSGLINSLIEKTLANDVNSPVLHPPVDWHGFYSGREVAWSGAIEHIKSHPWLGTGPDTYIFILPLLPGQTPHNMILQFALDWGWPAAIIALVGLVCLLWQALRQVYDLHVHWSLPGFWSASYIVFFIHGLVASTFYQPVDMLMVAIMIGVILSTLSNSLFTGHVRVGARSILSKSAIVLAAFFLLVNLMADYTMKVGRRLAKHKHVRDIELDVFHKFPFSGLNYYQGVEKLIERNPDKTMYYLSWGEKNSEYEGWRLTALKAKYFKLAGEDSKAEAAMLSALSKVPEVGAAEEWYIHANKETVYQIAGWKPEDPEQTINQHSEQ